MIEAAVFVILKYTEQENLQNKVDELARNGKGMWWLFFTLNILCFSFFKK